MGRISVVKENSLTVVGGGGGGRNLTDSIGYWFQVDIDRGKSHRLICNVVSWVEVPEQEDSTKH